MDFSIGDKVAYSVQFLKSIGMSHTEMGKARGIIKELKKLGNDVDNTTIATIKWDDEEMPHKVNTANLAKVGPNTRFCNCG